MNINVNIIQLTFNNVQDDFLLQLQDKIFKCYYMKQKYVSFYENNEDFPILQEISKGKWHFQNQNYNLSMKFLC